MRIYYDFHIHSCLSPCAEEEMTPNNIVNMAKLAGYDAIAIADHNSCKNCSPLIKVAEREGLIGLPAMELTTLEEIHVLCLFPQLAQAMDFGKFVFEKLIKVKNRPDVFGRQWIMDEYDQIVGEEEYLLTTATEISIDRVHSLVKAFGGEAIPAHIDRNSFSIFANLGFFDQDWGFTKVEYSRVCDRKQFISVHPDVAPLPWFIHSDAHWLSAMPDAEYYLPAEKKEAAAVFKAIQNYTI